ncbi:MAG: hypothetical protein ACKVZJ_09510 [Phycisphaerales bacterium]
MRSMLSFCAAGALLGLTTVAGSASGAMIVDGLYDLANHPDGSAQPPRYGLRLDELYNATPGHDQFTFDFEDTRSNMQMIISGNTVRIFGVTWGGRDTGAGYEVEPTTGLYTVDFLYNIGVGPVAGDDDIEVAASAAGLNSGTILSPTGDLIPMVDYAGSFPNTFRLGDEDNDLGHRGHAGISGWGWLNYNGGQHVAASDWLFTATLVPTPGAATLVLGAAAMTLRRRRSN